MGDTSKENAELIHIAGFKKGEKELWVPADTYHNVIGIFGKSEDGGYLLSLPGERKAVPMSMEVARTHMPHELMDWVEMWRNKAAEEKDYTCSYAVSGASLLFLYEGKMYELFPVALECSQELFEHLAGRMECNLADLGVAYTNYRGMSL